MLGIVLGLAVTATCGLTNDTQGYSTECQIWEESAVDALTDMFSRDIALGAVYELDHPATCDDDGRTELFIEVIENRLPRLLGRLLTDDEYGQLDETLTW